MKYINLYIERERVRNNQWKVILSTTTVKTRTKSLDNRQFLLDDSRTRCEHWAQRGPPRTYHKAEEQFEIEVKPKVIQATGEYKLRGTELSCEYRSFRTFTVTISIVIVIIDISRGNV